ncbi:restriction endonuclease subunit S [Yoonia sp. MH D7]
MKAGWEVKRLEDVTSKIGSGATPKGGRNAYKQEGIALIRSMNVHDLQFRPKDLARIDDDQAEKLSIVEVESSDVLLNITGASIARCCVVPPEIIPARVNQHVAIIRPDPDEIDSEFLAYLLVSKEHKDTLLGIGDDAGATRQALTKAHIQNYEIPIPPLAEQKQIVAVLDAAFEGLARAKDNAETNLQNARELFEAGLVSVFSTIEKKSEQKLLKEIALDFGRGKSKHRPRNAPFLYGGPYPFVQTGDVRNADHLITEYKQTYTDKGLAQSKLWPADTLCITIAANIAETAILSFSACFPDSIIGVVPDPKQTTSQYLEYLLQFFQKRLKARGEGAAQHNINLATFETEYFPFPSLSKQDAAIDMLDKTSAIVQVAEANYRTKLTDIADLRQSLLQKAFAGELT